MFPVASQAISCLAGADGKSTDCYTGLNSNYIYSYCSWYLISHIIHNCKGDGEIVRDCQESIPDGKTCKDAGTCEICLSHQCNEKIYPPTRLACHTCEGELCASPTSSSYCLKHDPLDKCATAFESDGKVSRKGCLYDFPDLLQTVCNSLTNDDCKTCDTKDCNALIVNRDGNMCFKCTGTDCFEPKSTELCLGSAEGKSVDCYSDINGKLMKAVEFD